MCARRAWSQQKLKFPSGLPGVSYKFIRIYFYGKVIFEQDKQMIKQLTLRIEDIISRPIAETGLFSLETLLLMLSRLYGMAVKVRHLLCRSRLLPPKKLPCFVISIGNITVGGTGKTPMTIHVADSIRQMGYKVAVISRGYRGTFEKSGGLVCDGQKIHCTPDASGDEPYLIAQTLSIPVLAGKNRYALALRAVREFGTQVIVLDDAFQHIALERDLDLVLLDAGAPFGNGALLPRGRLREPPASLRRCDAVILTRRDSQKHNRSLILDHAAGKPILETTHAPCISKLPPRFGQVSGKTSRQHFQTRYHDQKAFLFSGIANNPHFRKTCEYMGMRIADHLEFQDHYWYKAEDIQLILKRFKETDADVIATTRKDHVKIADRFTIPVPFVVVDVEIRFMADHDLQLATLIEKKLKQPV